MFRILLNIDINPIISTYYVIYDPVSRTFQSVLSLEESLWYTWNQGLLHFHVGPEMYLPIYSANKDQVG